MSRWVSGNQKKCLCLRGSYLTMRPERSMSLKWTVCTLFLKVSRVRSTSRGSKTNTPWLLSQTTWKSSKQAELQDHLDLVATLPCLPLYLSLCENQATVLKSNRFPWKNQCITEWNIASKNTDWPMTLWGRARNVLETLPLRIIWDLCPSAPLRYFSHNPNRLNTTILRSTSTLSPGLTRPDNVQDHRLTILFPTDLLIKIRHHRPKSPNEHLKVDQELFPHPRTSKYRLWELQTPTALEQIIYSLKNIRKGIYRTIMRGEDWWKQAMSIS